MGIVTEAGAGDRQDRGQDDCPPSSLAWLIITGSGRWTRTEDSWVVEQRVGWWAMSRGGEPALRHKLVIDPRIRQLPRERTRGRA